MSTLLLILGYGLAVPIAVRLGSVPRALLRPAVVGYQVGVLVAGLGWLLRGSWVIAVAHLLWAGLVPVVHRSRLARDESGVDGD